VRQSIVRRLGKAREITGNGPVERISVGTVPAAVVHYKGLRDGAAARRSWHASRVGGKD
jgi:hypothetical protein